MSAISRIMLGLAGAALLGASAMAAEAPSASPEKAAKPAARSCFFVTQWRGWKAPSPDVLYLGVNLHDVYKVELSTSTPELMWPDAHLVSIVRGSSSICDALDLDLKVSDGHGVLAPMIAKSMVKLTPEEVAAIPPKFRPN
jgi:hypothetical protein